MRLVARFTGRAGLAQIITLLARLPACEEVAQVQPERLPVVEPPVERLALRVDAVTSTELD